MYCGGLDGVHVCTCKLYILIDMSLKNRIHIHKCQWATFLASYERTYKILNVNVIGTLFQVHGGYCLPYFR